MHEINKIKQNLQDEVEDTKDDSIKIYCFEKS